MTTSVTPVRFRYFNSGTYTRSDMTGTIVHSDIKGVNAMSKSEVKTLVVNPNWKARLKKGDNVSSSYNRVGCIVRPSFCSCYGFGTIDDTIEFTTEGSAMTLDRTLSDRFFDGDDIALRDQALARLKRKLSSSVSKMNVLVPIAEIGQLRGTIRSVADSATGLVHALLEIRRTKGRSAFQFAADKWLTWSFGIAPMIGDINSLAQAIEAELSSSEHRVRLSGTANKKWRSSWAPGAMTGTYLADRNRSYEMEHQLSYRYVGGFDVDLQSANSYGLGSRFGLEFGALIPTMWELVPYSWIVDYFGTVGDFLEDTFISQSGVTKYLTCNRRYKVSCKVNSWYKPTASAGVKMHFSQHSTEGSVDYWEFDRAILSALPHRSLRLKTSDEIGRNAVAKLLNLSSLLIRR